MLINDKHNLGKFIESIARELDIPDHIYENATLKYEDVGEWLAEKDSDLSPYSPDIYPQGSFKLGTVVRPISEKDDYDVDLVCQLGIRKTTITQTLLKQMVGDRLKKREDLAAILKPSRRCWTLNYDGEENLPHFHIDVLPAIPNPDALPTGILITDTELKLWQSSNPRAYSLWFYRRMEKPFNERRMILAEEQKANIDEIPEWQIKTPLQVAIQIMKRHRDIYFQNDLDNRPISIIITTLAAAAYRDQANIVDAIADILHAIFNNWGKPGYVENRNGKWWVENPVDFKENFADKWNEKPEKKDAFFAWLSKIRSDFQDATRFSLLNESIDRFAPVLGSNTVNKVAGDFGYRRAIIDSSPSRAVASIPDIDNDSHCLRPKWPEHHVCKVKVVGTIHKTQYGKALWGLTNRSVPKNIWLKFHAQTNASSYDDIQWQVANSGPEARSHGGAGLRGDFYESEKGNPGVRWEQTSYLGTHWVEAFVIKSGICIGRSGRKLVRIR